MLTNYDFFPQILAGEPGDGCCKVPVDEYYALFLNVLAECWRYYLTLNYVLAGFPLAS